MKKLLVFLSISCFILSMESPFRETVKKDNQDDYDWTVHVHSAPDYKQILEVLSSSGKIDIIKDPQNPYHTTVSFDPNDSCTHALLISKFFHLGGHLVVEDKNPPRKKYKKRLTRNERRTRKKLKREVKKESKSRKEPDITLMTSRLLGMKIK